jgi:hypothetical protein
MVVFATLYFRSLCLAVLSNFLFINNYTSKPEKKQCNFGLCLGAIEFVPKSFGK